MGFIAVFLIKFFISLTLYSYDRIEVLSYLENNSFESVKSLYPENGKVYVLFPSKLSIYSSTLSYISSFDLKTQNAVSLAVFNEKIYVIDSKKCNVGVYLENGNMEFSFSGCGKEAGQLLSPSDIRVYNGRIFVSDLSGYINVYTDKGVFLYSFTTVSKSGVLYSPNKISFDPEGYLYILDIKKRIAARYDVYGKILSEYPYQSEILCFDISRGGFIYGGSSDGKVIEYDLKFFQTGTFGTKGKNRYEFLSFSDVKVYENGIFISDSKNKKILYLFVENKKSKKFKNNNFFAENIMIEPFDSKEVDGNVFNFYNDDIIYFSNNKNNQGVYTLSNNKDLKKIISYGNSESNIGDVADILFHKNRIYVLDTSSFKVKVFDENGKYLFSFGDRAGFLGGTKEGRFARPLKLSLDSSDKVYVVDGKLNMIQVFNTDGVFLYSVDISSYSKVDKFVDLLALEDKIYLLSENKIYIFSSDGRFEKDYELKNMSRAVSFAYDGVRYMFIIDGTGRIRVYDTNGNYVTSFIGKGSGITEISDPSFIRYKDSSIYISDYKRILSFKVDYIISFTSFSYHYDSQSGCVELNYTATNTEYVRDFTVERSTYEVFDVLSSNRDCELIDGTTYYYRIKAVSKNKEVYYSDIAGVFIPKKIENFTQQNKMVNRPPIEIIPLNLDYIFSANYKYYSSNPVGKVMVKNNTDSDFENMKLSFFIKEYMDFPYDTIIQKLPAGAQTEVFINATLNTKIITITENTPVQAKISLEYYVGDDKKEISINTPVRILSKNSMVWNDPARIANFITIKDPVISDTVKLLISKKDNLTSDVDENIKAFSLIHRYISGLGIKYVEDPITPFEISRSSPSVIDTVQYPRNLIKIKAGDCDDLTVLYASMLEAAGIETVIMDYQDHVTVMFELKENEIEDSFIPPNLIIKYRNKNYVPFEVTAISKSLYENIYYAYSDYKAKENLVRFYPVREIMKIYESPTFEDISESDIKIDENIIETAQKDCFDIERKYFDYYENYYRTILKQVPDSKQDLLKLGIILSFQEKYDEAIEIFEKIIKEDDSEPSALNNAANIYHMKGDYSRAQQYYEKAYQLDPYDANILVNAARNYMKMGKKEEAEMLFNKALSINPEIKKKKMIIFREER